MFLALFEKTKELGRQATFDDVFLDEKMPHPNDYAFYYGSFSQAAKKAWCMVENNEEFVRLEKKLEKGVKISSSNCYTTAAPKRKCKMDKKKDKEDGRMDENKIGLQEDISTVARELVAIDAKEKSTEFSNIANSKRNRYTSEECKEMLAKFCEKLQRVPTQAEVKAAGDELPSWPTLLKKVGPCETWSEIFGVPNSSKKEKRKITPKMTTKNTSESTPATAPKAIPPEVEEITEEIIPVERLISDEGVEMRLFLSKGVKGTITINLEF